MKFQNPIGVEFDSFTALHLAAEKGHFATFRFLVEKGASVKLQTNSGQTVLHLAAKGGHEDIMRYLLNINKRELDNMQRIQDTLIDVDAVDSQGHTPLHLACAHDNHVLVSI